MNNHIIREYLVWVISPDCYSPAAVKTGILDAFAEDKNREEINKVCDQRS